MTRVLVGLREIDFVRLALIVAVTWSLIILIQRLLPWLAERVPSRFRFYILPLVPVLRLIIRGKSALARIGVQPAVAPVVAAQPHSTR